jgi:hypothetical protein
MVPSESERIIAPEADDRAANGRYRMHAGCYRPRAGRGLLRTRSFSDNNLNERVGARQVGGRKSYFCHVPGRRSCSIPSGASSLLCLNNAGD